MMTFDLTQDYNSRALCMVGLIASNAEVLTERFFHSSPRNGVKPKQTGSIGQAGVRNSPVCSNPCLVVT